MANLGGFAGGIAQGLQTADQMNLRRQEVADNRDFNDRRLKIQEADEAERQAQRQRDEQMRQDSQALFKKYYGEQQEVVGQTTQDDGQGGTMTIPTVKTTTYQPGEDTPAGRERDAKWYTDHLMLVAKHSANGMSAQDMSTTAQRVDELRRKGVGDLLQKVATGDEDSVAALLKKTGKDPKGAKLDFRPVDGVNQIILGDGTTLDLKRYAAAFATTDVYKSMIDSEKNAQGAEHNKAQTADLNSQSNLRSAEAGTMPARTNLLNAQANRANAAANRERAVTSAVTDEKVNKQALAEINAVLEKDPNSVDGKGKNTDMAAYLQGRAVQLRSGSKMNAAQSVAQARQEWGTQSNRVSTFVDQEMQRLGKDGFKKAYGSGNADTVKSALLRKKMSEFSTASAPTGRASNLASTPADDTEE